MNNSADTTNIKKNSGFSLIELMVVVAIVALLSTVSVVTYSSYITRTKIYSTIDATKGLADKIKLYYDEHNAFPTIMSQIGVNSNTSDYPSTSITSVNDYAVPPYLYSFTISSSAGTPGSSCPYFAISTVVSNVNSNGAATSGTFSYSPGGNAMYYTSVYFLESYQKWTFVGQFFDPNTTTSTDPYSATITQYYNGAAVAGSSAASAVISAINSTC